MLAPLILLLAASEPTTPPEPPLTADDRRQIAEVFWSTWENNFRILRPKLREPEAANGLPELLEVAPVSCSGAQPKMRGYPGCDLRIRIRYASGKTEAAPVSWRFLKTEDGKWWDVGTYLRSRY